jgi:hypothetical protein
MAFSAAPFLNVRGEAALVEFESADVKSACRNQYRAAAIVITGVDSRLDRRCIERSAIAFRAIIPNVIDARAEIVSGHSRRPVAVPYDRKSINRQTPVDGILDGVTCPANSFANIFLLTIVVMTIILEMWSNSPTRSG